MRQEGVEAKTEQSTRELADAHPIWYFRGVGAVAGGGEAFSLSGLSTEAAMATR